MILSEAAKKKVPKSRLGNPAKKGTGSYPMPDAEHAKAAVGLAAMHHGKDSPFTKKIRRKAKSLGYLKSGDEKMRTLGELA